MSKYNIVLNADSPTINSLDNVVISELPSVVSGTATHVLCEVLDNLSYEDRLKTLGLMIKKLSFNGELTLKFINVFKICKDLIRGNINSKSWSEIIENYKSMFAESDILDIVSKTNNIRIDKIYNSNNYVIVVLKKIND